MFFIFETNRLYVAQLELWYLTSPDFGHIHPVGFQVFAFDQKAIVRKVAGGLWCCCMGSDTDRKQSYCEYCSEKITHRSLLCSRCARSSLSQKPCLLCREIPNFPIKSWTEFSTQGDAKDKLSKPKKNDPGGPFCCFSQPGH